MKLLNSVFLKSWFSHEGLIGKSRDDTWMSDLKPTVNILAVVCPTSRMGKWLLLASRRSSWPQFGKSPCSWQRRAWRRRDSHALALEMVAWKRRPRLSCCKWCSSVQWSSSRSPDSCLLPWWRASSLSTTLCGCLCSVSCCPPLLFRSLPVPGASQCHFSVKNNLWRVQTVARVGFSETFETWSNTLSHSSVESEQT